MPPCPSLLGWCLQFPCGYSLLVLWMGRKLGNLFVLNTDLQQTSYFQPPPLWHQPPFSCISWLSWVFLGFYEANHLIFHWYVFLHVLNCRIICTAESVISISYFYLLLKTIQSLYATQCSPKNHHAMPNGPIKTTRLINKNRGTMSKIFTIDSKNIGT